MPEPEKRDPGAGPGLFSDLRSFWGVLVAIFYTRLDLATTELEESGTYALQLIILSLAALLVVLMTAFFLLFFLVVAFWEERVVILVVVSSLCVLASAILIFAVRRMIRTRPRFFAQTLAELRRDVDGLRPTPAPARKSTEVKP